MKKLISFFTVLFIALVTLTSCDEDIMISYDLKGTWEGEMYTYYEFNGHTQKVSYTEIEFLSNPYENRSGYGYWVDHFSRRPGDYYYSRIDWEVRNGRIYINFRSEGTSIEIYDYKLNGRRFTGWFKDGIHTNTEFNLTKTSDSCNSYEYDYGWGDHSYYYDYYYDDYYYGYSKATRSASDSTSIANKPMPVRKFMKK